LARRLSESLRTRGTIINLEARLADFSEYAKHNPEAVHPTILGFLSYKPALLHAHDPDADRFPTPRSWTEVSSYLFAFDPDADILEDKSNRAWKTIISLKCGDPASNDFHAWWEIVAKIDVKKLLTTGELEHTMDTENEAIVHYAAVFAVAQELNNKGPKKEHKGLGTYLRNLHPEHRVALGMQLTDSTRGKVIKVLPEAADLMMSYVRMGA
jgi:hypothetical protein